MDDNSIDLQRRSLLVSAAGVAVGLALNVSAQTSTTAEAEEEAQGKPGDFDFLAGNWKISHRQLKGKEWDEYKGEATCWTVLGGVASIEELRIPARNFSGMGVRVLDVEKRVWSDFWVNARSGVLGCPGLTGVFKKGVGTFTAEEMDNGQPILARGVWDRITPTSCRWHQAVSRDGGKTWEPNWFMDWQKV
ncbi:MAG TPA: hypothetical protein VGQ76_11680 [Thermoanaerobaculia bacterium]|jgi:hypothetical protein|nr:hypothetical protein [Thermoanaerobaculia bacterium]